MEERLKEIVYTAVGEASTCWVGGTGSLEFDSILADEVAKKLCKDIVKHFESVRNAKIMEADYVKIDKNLLMVQYNFLKDRLSKIDRLDKNGDFPHYKEVEKLRGSFQDLSYILSKVEPL